MTTGWGAPVHGYELAKNIATDNHEAQEELWNWHIAGTDVRDDGSQGALARRRRPEKGDVREKE